MGVLLLFLFITLLLLLFIKFSTKSTELADVKEIYHQYKLTSYDMNTNRTERSFVSIPRFLEPAEYISYTDSHGRINLISNFGANEYICTGKCYCADDEDNFTIERRKGKKDLVEGIIYIVVGTVVLGYSFYHLYKSIGQDWWTDLVEQCEKMLFVENEEEVCEKPVTELVDCEEISPSARLDVNDVSIYFKQEQKQQGNIFCSGHCVTGTELFNSNQDNSLAVVIGCEEKAMATQINLVEEGELESMRSEIITSSSPSSSPFVISIPEVQDDPLATYRSWFVVKHLQPFCSKHFQIGEKEVDGEAYICDVQENSIHGIDDSKNYNYGCYYG